MIDLSQYRSIQIVGSPFLHETPNIHLMERSDLVLQPLHEYSDFVDCRVLKDRYSDQERVQLSYADYAKALLMSGAQAQESS